VAADRQACPPFHSREGLLTRAFFPSRPAADAQFELDAEREVGQESVVDDGVDDHDQRRQLVHPESRSLQGTECRLGGSWTMCPRGSPATARRLVGGSYTLRRQREKTSSTAGRTDRGASTKRRSPGCM
jgi:hypothetical protein